MQFEISYGGKGKFVNLEWLITWLLVLQPLLEIYKSSFIYWMYVDKPFF
jgi:hypothetical protein